MPAQNASDAKSAVMAATHVDDAQPAVLGPRALTQDTANAYILRSSELPWSPHGRWYGCADTPQRKLEKVSKTLEEYRTIFDRLYPDYEVSHLLSLPRQELLDILNMSNQTPSPTNWLPSPPPNPIPYHQDFDVNPFPPNSFEGVDVSQFVDGGINWVGNGKQLSFLTY